jgi:hypothetical protein
MSGELLHFPFGKTIGAVPNDARMEWLFRALDGHLNVVKKRLILEARTPEVGFLGDQQATILISALGLEGC